MCRKFLYLFLFSSLLYGMQTISKPEIRYAYQYLEPKCTNQVVLARFDETLIFPSKSTLFFRLDVPFLRFHCRQIEFIEVDEEGVVNPGKPVGKTHTETITHHTKEEGLADILTKIYYTAIWDCWTAGFGSEFIFPTARSKELGTGKVQACPTVDIRYRFSPNKWICLLSKFEFSFAGPSNRPPIDIWFIQPKVEFTFPDRWIASVDFDMQYNWNEKKWFVPIDFSVTKGFTPQFSLALVYKVGIVTDFPVFRQVGEIGGSYAF